MRTKIGIIMLLVVGLMILTAGLISAQDDDGGKVAEDRQGYVGVFNFAPGTGAFFVTTNKGEMIEIQDPAGGLESITRRPGQPDGSPGDGDRVAVLVEFVGAALVKVARQVIVRPTPLLPVIGAVVSVATNDEGVRILSIMRPDGTTKEVQLGPEARAPQVGDLVTAFPGRGGINDGGDGGDGPPVIRGLVRAAEVSERLAGFLDDLTTQAGGPPSDLADRQAQRIADLAARLEAHTAKHLEIIQRVSQNANLPAQAVAGMQNGLDRAQSGRTQAFAKAAEARTKAGPPPGRGRPGS